MVPSGWLILTLVTPLMFSYQNLKSDLIKIASCFIDFFQHCHLKLPHVL